MSILEVWNGCQDLSSDARAGFMTVPEFNRCLLLAERTLLEFHADNEKIQGSNALRPFYEPAKLPVDTQGYVSLPVDFYREKDFEVLRLLNPENCAGEVTEFNYTVEYVKPEELTLTLRSPIRKPVENKRYIVSIYDGRFRVYPFGKAGRLHLMYLRYPRASKIAFTGNEQYDEENSVNPEWPDEQLGNLVDLMLYYKGMTIRETELLKWVVSGKQKELIRP